jgi:cytochrome c-type biogenesis protein CcmE
MQTKTRFLIGSALLVAAVAYLMYSGVQQSSVYYLTIEEFLARKEALADEGIRIAGRVAMGSVDRKMTPNGEEINFRLGDFTGEVEAPETVPVHFVGVTPDMFKSEGGSDVIVEGKYRDGKIHAQSVLTSCPSKYEAESETSS